MSFPPLAKPSSLLGWHRQLAPNAGVKVSPLCLGTMSLGTAWADFMGAVDEKASFELLDYFYEHGGNFLDTASNYQEQESEIIIGKWMKTRGNRDEMVVATKYTTGWQSARGTEIIQSNYGGMNAKNLRHCLAASLKKLQTDFVDVLYIHWWDYSADIPEVMRALNDVVTQGKVLYLGISDTPAWIVAKANEYARGHNLTPFVVYQGRYNAASRDMERDIIPMCRSEGMGIAPWAALGGGHFKTKEMRAKDSARTMRIAPAPSTEKIIAKLDEIANRKNTMLTSIALAYVMHKTPYCFPIVGGRKVEHLKGNIEALGVQLSGEDIDEIEAVAPFDFGFPSNLFLKNGKPSDVSSCIMAGDNVGNAMFVRMDEVAYPQPIQNGMHKDE